MYTIPLLLTLVAQNPPIDFDSLPPFGASREIVEPILKATGRDLPSEREWEYLQHHLATSSRVKFRDAAVVARDKGWIERCDLAAQKSFGRNATSGELLVWQSYGFACHDAAVLVHTVRKTHGGKPARVKGRVIDDKTSEPIKGARLFGQWPAVVSTDADGGFEIETGRDYDGSTSLVIESEGKASELLRISADADAAAPASIRLSPEATYVGEVQGADGKPLANASVAVSASAGDYRSQLQFATSTDVDGRFRLAGWGNPRFKSGYVSIRANGFEGASQTLPTGPNVPATQNSPAVLKLKPAPEVSGQVVDEQGAPLAAVNVEVRNPGISGYVAETFSDEEGRFRMFAAAGPHVIVAEKTGLTLGHVRIDLNDESGRNLKIVMPSAGGFIEGKTLLPDGKPASNCSIGWVRRASKANGNGDQFNDELGSNHHTVTDDEGRFRVGPFDPKEGYEVMGLIDPPRMTGKVIAKPGDADVVIQLAKEGR